MADEEKKKSFWETLPGIITAAGTLITAITGLLVALNRNPIIPPPPPNTKIDGPKPGDTMTDDATGMKLAYVADDCFMMGSSADDKGHEDDEGPVHEVCVDGVYMGKYEVTQGQWEKVMGSNPSNFKKGGNYPVERVSWNDAQDFVKKMNSKSGKQYRLPTEAEWEYACRAGGSGKYCGGDDVDAVAWYDRNSGDGTHPVGGKDANVFGLHDMSGNVWE